MAELPTDQPGDVRMDLQRHEMIYPEFSIFSVENRHRLPISEEFGTCGVQVCFDQDFAYDYSSWRLIRLRILDVLARCVELDRAGSGGWTITGWENHMKVILYSTSHNDAATSGLNVVTLTNTTAVAR